MAAATYVVPVVIKCLLHMLWRQQPAGMAGSCAHIQTVWEKPTSPTTSPRWEKTLLSDDILRCRLGTSCPAADSA